MGGKKAMRHFLNALSFAVALLPATLCAAQIQGKVIRVLDGDTIEVLQEQQPVRVRLLNIDAPEKNNPLDAGQLINLKPSCRTIRYRLLYANRSLRANPGTSDNSERHRG
jgi:endonuclease YncB( thermonuclease family)